MSYQVLARKWRPKNFKELMGQEHVVTVLVNALEQERLHHAYLFTGTRGVGKTTIARIFAKSLNCQVGITSEPCGKCDTCLDIDLGRFVDLIEIDAASKTKVDDTREILDNVQYAPTSGRYKVYLIDEVHMLSRSSFNALLKTLEEPPEHVKFILATTDPQKLPVTVLSRCLQFHLKALTVSQIEQQLNLILAAENVKADKGSVTLLAKAARGSMRDSLSLTDQSIAQGAGEITLSNVQKMLGGVDQSWVYKILISLIKQDSKQLMELSLNIASYSPSYSRLLAELIQLLHQVAMVQIVDRHFDLPPEHEVLLKKFAKAMSPEDVQLYYQIVLNGRKDLPYASDEQAAFDMVLLRLLAFKPVINASELPKVDTSVSSSDDSTAIEDFDTKSLTDSMEKDPIIERETPALHAIKSSSQSTTEDVVGESREHLEYQENNQNTISTEEDMHSQLSAEMESIEQVAAQHIQQQPIHTTPQQNEQQIPDVDNTQQAVDVETSQSQSSEVTEFAQPQQSVQVARSENNVEPEYKQHSEVDLSVSNEQVSSSQVYPEQPHDVSTNNFQHQHPTEQPITQPTVTQEETVTYSSPIESAIATRNMLRSRKKQMEQQVKKPNDVAGRQIQITDAAVNSTKIEKEPEQVVEPIEMVIDEPYREELIDPAKIKSANQVDKWANMIDSMALSARIRQIAIHATISEESTDNHLILSLDQSTKHLKTDAAVEQLQQSISNYLSKPVTVEINLVEETKADPYKIQVDINDKRYQYAVNLLKEDEIVKGLQENFQAELDENTIQAL
ncbi:DNA polymerase III subunit gamma/tau [Pseudocolwellia sp. AS88]|uniref:DNA polymerase III subunit gamma/tau n=1 Tax=Pseudocolwellia sp. AS88 TaxID=3063958 RepID=UPI0026F0B347|nr:DNA polymerase III subunit gamma/tau [Pseudocolwellia sp. AS88]MDO7083398.1 DNA polymerase III subunit gamma/tau [Pseudocolwellia sp. AS88]